MPQAYVYFSEETYRALSNLAFSEHTSVSRIASRILDKHFGGAKTHGRKEGK